MEIKVVPMCNSNNKSKYNDYWAYLFTDENINDLKRSVESIRNKDLGVIIDITSIKDYSDRKNKINERGYIDDSGQITAYGSIAKSLAIYLQMIGLSNIYFAIKESRNGRINLIIKDLTIHRLKHKSFK